MITDSYSLFPLFMRACALSRVRLFRTPQTLACQAPLSMGFSRQEYCSGLPFPSSDPLAPTGPGHRGEGLPDPALPSRSWTPCGIRWTSLQKRMWSWNWSFSGAWSHPRAPLGRVSGAPVAGLWVGAASCFPVAIGASLVAQTVKNVCSARNPGSIPRLGRSPGEGNGYPLQYPCVEHPVDRGAWWGTDQGFAESDTTEQLTLSLFFFFIVGLASGFIPFPQVWCQG